MTDFPSLPCLPAPSSSLSPGNWWAQLQGELGQGSYPVWKAKAPMPPRGAPTQFPALLGCPRVCQPCSHAPHVKGPLEFSCGYSPATLGSSLATVRWSGWTCIGPRPSTLFPLCPLSSEGLSKTWIEPLNPVTGLEEEARLKVAPLPHQDLPKWMHLLFHHPPPPAQALLEAQGIVKPAIII